MQFEIPPCWEGSGGGEFMMICADGYDWFRVVEGLKEFPGTVIRFQFVPHGAEGVGRLRLPNQG